MGRTVYIEAIVEMDGAGAPADYIVLPFVNQRRWGAHERPNAEGRATFQLPLPNPGPAAIQVVALPSDTGHWKGLHARTDLLLAGQPLPEDGMHSNVLSLTVTRRLIPLWDTGGTLFGLQWEPWFTGGIARWGTAQAVPLVGFYDSYNRDVLRQHFLWCMDLGVDFILPDWTNHLWGKQHWDERADGVNAIIHATTLALEVLAEMRDEGLPVPKMVLFPGLSNGQPATMTALNEELAWIYHTYVRNPRFDGLWLEFDGKPLIVVLDTGAVGDPRGTAEAAFRIPFFKETLALSEAELDAFRAAQGPVDETHFTVRWMSSQNQTTRHHELGYWSWMDGVSDPPVTYRNGIAEAATVTPAFFHQYGWTARSSTPQALPAAWGRRGGVTYLETFKTALAHRPRVIFLHQFNEYSGQREGHGLGPERKIYLDTYSVELSDDLEPVSLTAPGYRGDDGGWGFYYLNLTQALMALYRGTANGCTILAVGNPFRNAVVTGDTLRVTWSVIGAPPEDFSLWLDGNLVQAHITATEAAIPLAEMTPGPHTLTVIANGAVTRFRLSQTELDVPLETPIPVRVDAPFTLL